MSFIYYTRSSAGADKQCDAFIDQSVFTEIVLYVLMCH